MKRDVLYRNSMGILNASQWPRFYSLWWWKIGWLLPRLGGHSWFRGLRSRWDLAIRVRSALLSESFRPSNSSIAPQLQVPEVIDLIGRFFSKAGRLKASEGQAFGHVPKCLACPVLMA